MLVGHGDQVGDIRVQSLSKTARQHQSRSPSHEYGRNSRRVLDCIQRDLSLKLTSDPAAMSGLVTATKALDDGLT